MKESLREPKVISLKDENFSKEVVPGVALMKHTFGNNLSIALFKIEKGQGGKFPANLHAHGDPGQKIAAKVDFRRRAG